jgi:hypothetical protein
LGQGGERRDLAVIIPCGFAKVLQAYRSWVKIV